MINYEKEKARCIREIERMKVMDGVHLSPKAWLCTLGQEDWAMELRLIEEEERNARG